MIKMGFLEHFQQNNQTLEIFSKAFFGMQPNTWKYFSFPKIAFLENKYFPENILHEPNTALVDRRAPCITHSWMVDSVEVTLHENPSSCKRHFEQLTENLFDSVQKAFNLYHPYCR